MRKKALKEVSIFFSVTIFLSYCIFWGPIALFKIPTVNLVRGGMGPIWAIVLIIIGGFVPSITGIVLTGVFEGKDGVRNLFAKSIQLKLGLKWFSFIIVIAIYYAFSLIFLYTITGGNFDYSQFWIQLPTIFPLIILGPLSEEYGWRGFALERLLKCVNANLASLIIGVIWSLWHLPLFFMVGSSQYEFNIPFLVFLVSVTSTSYIYTYIYIRTKQSLFSAIFIHWIYTYVIQVVSSSVIRSDLYNWLEFVPSLLIGIGFAYVLRNKKRNTYIVKN